MPVEPTTSIGTVDRAIDAARSMYETLTSNGFSAAEKLAVRKQIDVLLRQELDEEISALQQLRSSF